MTPPNLLCASNGIDAKYKQSEGKPQIIFSVFIIVCVCCWISFGTVTCIRIIAITITLTSSTWLYYFGASYIHNLHTRVCARTFRCSFFSASAFFSLGSTDKEAHTIHLETDDRNTQLWKVKQKKQQQHSHCNVIDIHLKRLWWEPCVLFGDSSTNHFGPKIWIQSSHRNGTGKFQ